MSKFGRDGVVRKKIYAKNWRVLGEVVADTYFTVRSTQHYFVKYQGFGLSHEVLDELIELQVKWIVFEYYGKLEKKMYRVKLMEFLRYGKDYVDDSWGDVDKQIIMPVDKMTIVKGVDEKRETI